MPESSVEDSFSMKYSAELWLSDMDFVAPQADDL
jgi:hypothetical protein